MLTMWDQNPMFGGFAPQPGQEARRYVARGWVPVLLGTPATGSGKIPQLPGYADMRPTRADVDAWWAQTPTANVGLLLDTSGLLVLDFDSAAGKAEAQAKGLPPTLVALTAHGEHWYYTRPADCPTRRCLHRGASRKIDILSLGFVVAPPSMHAEGTRYRWRDGYGALDAFAQGLPAPPDWAVEVLTLAEKQANAALQVAQPTDWRLPKQAMLQRSKGEVYSRDNDADERIVQRALDCIPAEDYDVWFRVGLALARWDSQGDGRGRGFDMWDRWSATSAKYPGRAALQTKWRSFGAHGGVQVATLYGIAAEHGFDRKEEGERLREQRRKEHDPARDARLRTTPAQPRGSWFAPKAREKERADG
jgi:hypothetical protein